MNGLLDKILIGKKVCCFCNLQIKTKKEELEIGVSLFDGGTQGFFAHYGCLKKNIHKEIPFI